MALGGYSSQPGSGFPGTELLLFETKTLLLVSWALQFWSLSPTTATVRDRGAERSRIGRGWPAGAL